MGMVLIFLFRLNSVVCYGLSWVLPSWHAAVDKLSSDSNLNGKYYSYYGKGNFAAFGLYHVFGIFFTMINAGWMMLCVIWFMQDHARVSTRIKAQEFSSHASACGFGKGEGAGLGDTVNDSLLESKNLP